MTGLALLTLLLTALPGLPAREVPPYVELLPQGSVVRPATVLEVDDRETVPGGGPLPGKVAPLPDGVPPPPEDGVPPPPEDGVAGSNAAFANHTNYEALYYTLYANKTRNEGTGTTTTIRPPVPQSTARPNGSTTTRPAATLTWRCRDQSTHCPSWAHAGYCNIYPVWVSCKCKWSCRLCESCKDKDDNCAAWAADQQCTINPGYMLVNCRVSCGLC